MKSLLAALAATFALASVEPALAQARSPASVEDLFEPEHQDQLVLNVEAAIAQAQAAEGVIPASAAREIAAKAHIRNAPLAEVRKEYAKVRHRMVAILNVWKRSMSKEAADHVHFGVTTVDVYDTVLTLQVRESIRLLLADMLAIEDSLVALAKEHRDTPMIGRTLGQQPCPSRSARRLPSGPP